MFSEKQIIERSILTPNEGVRRSIINGVIFTLIVGLIFGLFIGWFDVNGPLDGLISGSLFGIGGGLIAGLQAAIQHYTLRFWLSQTHLLPWKTVPFLNDATTRILLRRIGSGYSFTHRLLLEHLADRQASSI
ncbi:hypothetical protein [Reticulibacter mediterranei]|nr:hypothetical protein [Reticulibacter mediterranei]